MNRSITFLLAIILLSLVSCTHETTPSLQERMFGSWDYGYLEYREYNIADSLFFEFVDSMGTIAFNSDSTGVITYSSIVQSDDFMWMVDAPDRVSLVFDSTPMIHFNVLVNEMNQQEWRGRTDADSLGNYMTYKLKMNR